jgi:hypothetical protein
MKISIYAPYAKERLETASQRSILHPGRIVGKPEAIQMSIVRMGTHKSASRQQFNSHC